MTTDTITLSRLDRQRDNARRGNAQHRTFHDELMAEFARLNGCVASHSDFALSTLARAGTTDSISGTWGTMCRYPAADHHSYLRRNRRAEAAIIEPYESGEVAELPSYLARHGLIQHSPPNPRASFWWPGVTRFIVITRPDFGEVRWLPEQLAF